MDRRTATLLHTQKVSRKLRRGLLPGGTVMQPTFGTGEIDCGLGAGHPANMRAESALS
jgi:hypothetical protein